MTLLPFDVPFSEAVDHFRDVIVLTREQFDRLDLWTKKHAFTAARVQEGRILQSLKDKLQRVIEEGGTLAEFQADALGISSQAHLENIFRTSGQFAFGCGRREQQQSVREWYPFLLYDAIDDGRTRPQHRAWDGTVLPQNDPFWRRAYPPSDYQCRCVAEELSQDEAEALGIDRVNLFEDDGSDFGSPGISDEWIPDLRNLDPDLRARVREAIERFSGDDVAE